MADKKKNKPAIKTPSVKKQKLANILTLDEQDKANKINIEDIYPGVTEQIQRYKEVELPSCPHCSSSNTARVSYGIIGRSITIAASTSKIKLIGNPPAPGKYFCNACAKFFD